MMVAKQWLNEPAAADYSGYSERTIRRAFRDYDADPAGGLRYVKNGASVRTTTEWVDDWIDRRSRDR